MRYKVTRVADQQDFTSLFLMHVMTERAERTKKDFLKMFNIVPGEGDLDVELKINGVEIDVADFFALVETQMDSMVTKRAKELLAERLNDVRTLLDNLESDVKQRVAKVFPDSAR